MSSLSLGDRRRSPCSGLKLTSRSLEYLRTLGSSVRYLVVSKTVSRSLEYLRAVSSVRYLIVSETSDDGEGLWCLESEVGLVGSDLLLCLAEEWEDISSLMRGEDWFDWLESSLYLDDDWLLNEWLKWSSLALNERLEWSLERLDVSLLRDDWLLDCPSLCLGDVWLENCSTLFLEWPVLSSLLFVEDSSLDLCFVVLCAESLCSLSAFSSL